MPIYEWPESERPRERLMSLGAAKLRNEELLAVLLGSGLRGGSAVDLGRELLEHFGSLSDLVASPSTACMRQPGLGLARYARLRAGLEMSRRMHLELLSQMAVASARETAQVLVREQLGVLPYQVLGCFYFDRRHRLIAFEEAFRGTVEHVHGYPREIVRRALHHEAAAVITARNEPSGVAEAESLDERFAKRLREALAVIDLELLDYWIVSGRECLSFVERGLLPRPTVALRVPDQLCLNLRVSQAPAASASIIEA
jgi:DNA repair protein RadC